METGASGETMFFEIKKISKPAVAVGVGVAKTVTVEVAVGEKVGVKVKDGVAIAVGVGVGEKRGGGVWVAVNVGVGVRVGVAVPPAGVGVNVGEGAQLMKTVTLFEAKAPKGEVIVAALLRTHMSCAASTKKSTAVKVTAQQKEVPV